MHALLLGKKLVVVWRITGSRRVPVTQEAHLVRELDGTAEFLLENLRAGDLLIVFSAGDAVEISAKVFTGLIEREVAA